MKRLLSDKVFRRLVLGNLLLGGLLGLATWLSLRANYQADLDLGVAVTRHQARSLSLELTAEMRMVDNALATIAGRYRSRSHESPGEAAIALYDLLQEQRGLIPFVTALRVADARGQVMLSANEDEPAFSVADRAYFERARHSEQMVVSDPLISHSFHQWAIVLARRLQSADGQFQGIVYAIVAAEHFQSLFRRQAFGPDSAMALRSDRDLLVARYTAADPLSMTGIGGSEVSREYHHALGNDRELGWYITPTRLDGVERITAYHRLAGYPLTVFTGLGTDSYLAAWRASAWRAWALTGLCMLLIALGSVSLYLLQQRERMARLKLSELLRQQELFMDNDLIGIARLRERRLLWTNQALQRMLKRPADELRNTSARILYPDEETYERSGELAYGALRSSGKCHTQMQLQTRDGGLLWVDVSGAGLADGESIWVFVDIDALKRGEQAARHQALHDALTGLANRRALEMRLRRDLAQAGGPGQLAVCFMDLDGFKQVNDSEGHDAGDEVLRIVARRLTTQARETDCVARLGGDEFVVLLGELAQADDALQVMQRCLASIGQPIRLQGGATVQVGASMGIALNLPQEDAAQLLQRADEAMYAAKRAGKGRIVAAGGRNVIDGGDGAGLRAGKPPGSAGRDFDGGA